MKKQLLLIALLAIGLLISGCTNSTQEKGLLHGKVLITPTSSAETLACSFYDIRKILIYDKSGEDLLFTVDIECNADEQYARYRVELEPGVYMVDITYIGIDSSSDVPKIVEITSGVTERLDIDIDTGIR